MRALIFYVPMSAHFFKTKFSYGGQKIYPIILNHVSYGLYPAGNAILQANKSKIRMIWQFIRISSICLTGMVSHVVIFGRGEETNPVIEGCFKKCNKIIWKTLMMKYFSSKVANLQRDIF